MDFSLSPPIEAMRKRVRDYVNDRLIPLESDPASYDHHENIAHGLLQEIRKETRAMGIWALQSPKARGGGGLKMAEQAVLYEEMNRSIFCPGSFNCSATCGCWRRWPPRRSRTAGCSRSLTGGSTPPS